MNQPETRFAPGPAGAVGYQVFGEGPLDIVFVPSWPSNVDVMWQEPRIERFFQRLSSFGRVIVFDQRGTGVSDPVPLGALPTLEEWTDDIRIVMNEAGSERAAVVSTGGGDYRAILFAASYPERTSALVLIDGLACSKRHDDYEWGFPDELVDRAVVEFAAGWGKGLTANLMAPSLTLDERGRRWWAMFERASMSPQSVRSTFRWGFDLDVRHILPSIRVPTLVIHRSEDRFVRVENGRYLAENIAGAKYVELPGADNFYFAGDQEAILEEIGSFLTGARDVLEHDRVLTTVLFTDIVGSTKHAAQIGDKRWREVIDLHDALTERSLDRFRGRRVRSTGDGTLATFDGPARGIRCAADIEGNLRDLGLEIRAGLHTGEVELRGEDLGGIAVHLASRVMSLAGPGEVLVSSTVKDLVVGSGIEFEDRGNHSLRDVPGEWRLYAAKA